MISCDIDIALRWLIFSSRYFTDSHAPMPQRQQPRLITDASRHWWFQPRYAITAALLAEPQSWGWFSLELRLKVQPDATAGFQRFSSDIFHSRIYHFLFIYHVRARQLHVRDTCSDEPISLPQRCILSFAIEISHRLLHTLPLNNWQIHSWGRQPAAREWPHYNRKNNRMISLH
jgi:hypothetical protein